MLSLRLHIMQVDTIKINFQIDITQTDVTHVNTVGIFQIYIHLDRHNPN